MKTKQICIWLLIMILTILVPSQPKCIYAGQRDDMPCRLARQSTPEVASVKPEKECREQKARDESGQGACQQDRLLLLILLAITARHR